MEYRIVAQITQHLRTQKQEIDAELQAQASQVAQTTKSFNALQTQMTQHLANHLDLFATQLLQASLEL